VDSWVAATYGDDAKYRPPSEVSTQYFHPEGKDEPWVEIVDPEQDTPPLEFDIRVEVITPYTVNKVEFYLDGEQLGGAVTSVPYERHVELSEDEVGEHEIWVQAYDSAGNVGEATKDITVVAD